MPCPHYRLERINRRSGRSAVGKVRYIERGGDYARRADEVLSQGHAGPDLGTWEQVDRAERRRDAVVCLELITPLPPGLPGAAEDRAVQDHAEHIRAQTGCAVRWAKHRASRKGDQRNRHAHVIITTRAVTNDGEINARKAQRWERKHGGRELIAALRSHWQDRINTELQAAGRDERVDLRTNAARGLGLALQRVGKVEYERARRGKITSKKYERNQKILALREATDAAAKADAEIRAAHERLDRAIAVAEREQRDRIVIIGARILGRTAQGRSRHGQADGHALGGPASGRRHGLRARPIPDQLAEARLGPSLEGDAGVVVGGDAPIRELHRRGEPEGTPALGIGAPSGARAADLDGVATAKGEHPGFATAPAPTAGPATGGRPERPRLHHRGAPEGVEPTSRLMVSRRPAVATGTTGVDGERRGGAGYRSDATNPGPADGTRGSGSDPLRATGSDGERVAGGKRSFAVRVWRALTGAEARETTTSAAEVVRQRRERSRTIMQAGADLANASRAAREARETRDRTDKLAVQEAQRAASVAAACADVAARPTLAMHPQARPVFAVVTATGGTYHIRPADLAFTRAHDLTNVPLCGYDGEPLHTVNGYKGRLALRRSTVEGAVIVVTLAAQDARGRVIEEMPIASEHAALVAQAAGTIHEHEQAPENNEQPCPEGQGAGL